MSFLIISMNSDANLGAIYNLWDLEIRLKPESKEAPSLLLSLRFLGC